MKKRATGFTLIEMIGVIAVIGILASVAAPMIFDAIRKARVTAFVEDANAVKTAVTNYYNDTGVFPVHSNTDDRDGRQRLLRDSTTSPIAGWSGPYIEKQLTNPFRAGGLVFLESSTNANYQFDLDGDGTVDTTTVSVLRVDNVSDVDAQRISDVLDDDGDITTGDDRWQAAGRVKRYGVDSNSASIVLVYMASE
ncbi:MAG: type II secretion system protein [Gammaproteobacteria bacterium]